MTHDKEAAKPQIPGVEEIRDPQGTLLAIILRSTFHKPGVNFISPNELSQQIGYISHPAGKHIAPHVHNLAPRQVQLTQEVLLIRKGKLRVDFYDAKQAYLSSTLLIAGDSVLLIQGGHGFEVLEEVDMIEVKQGPYVGEHDKTRFQAINSQEIRWLNPDLS